MSSKHAVLLLLFFIVSGIITSSFPVFLRGFGESLGLDNQIARSFLASQYTPLKTVSKQYPREINILLTAYSSSPNETDDTPFITASGIHTHDGVVAANFLPFGTRIRIPDIFGDRVFTVEDRLKKIYNDRIDIWFASKKEALNFGSQFATVEVL